MRKRGLISVLILSLLLSSTIPHKIQAVTEQAKTAKTSDNYVEGEAIVTLNASSETGLAKEGMIPFCNVYSSFMQRAYDMVIHDVALQNLHMVICLDRAGLVGEDGATHHGVFDLAYLRPVPNLVISSPLNELDLRNLMYTGYKECNGPFVIRYPRGKGEMADWRNEMHILPIGKGKKLRDGDDIAILSLGPIGLSLIHI